MTLHAKGGNAQFTTVPLEPVSEHGTASLKVFNSENSSRFTCSRTPVPYVVKPQLKMTTNF